MTDDFDTLRAALGRPTPPPDAEAKKAAITLALKNFDHLHQGPEASLRPNQDRPQGAGFLKGMRKMLSRLTSRPVLAATTSAAALCLGLVVVLPMKSPLTGTSTLTGTEELAPKNAPAKPDAAVAKGQQPQVVAAPPGQPTAPARSEDAQIAIGGAVDTGTAPETHPAPQADLRSDYATAEAAPAESEATPPPPPPPFVSSDTQSVSPITGGALYAESPRTEAKRSTRSRVPAAPLAAVAPMITDEIAPEPEQNTEAFANADTNPVKVTAETPVSTFSADVDTASYAVIRSSLMNGQLPPPDAVRVEEMVNYFPYSYPAPNADDDAPFKASVSVMPTPWNANTRLVRIGLQGRMPAMADRPPLNLVFLVDTSGSMQDANKLPLLKQSLRLMLPHLRPDDQVAIVAYAGSAGEVLEPTKAGEQGKILAALDRLEAGGSTAGAEGLELAYRVAKGMTRKGDVSRVLLATDGDFNVGISEPEGLEKYVEKKREQGTYLSVLGFGRGNLDDATMQSLAQNGNGTAAYIDTLQEARKVLVDQLSGALFPIADDVKLQVEWNPKEVAEYRLIGYETRALKREDFNNDRVDAGEIGAGHTVTALYEVTAPGSPAILNTPLRYSTADSAVGEVGPATGAGAGELGFLRLRYKEPGQTVSKLMTTPITASDTAPDEDARFAAAIAGFGQLLKGGQYLGNWGWDKAIALAVSARGTDEFGYRAEAVNLMRLAQSLAAQ